MCSWARPPSLQGLVRMTSRSLCSSPPLSPATGLEDITIQGTTYSRDHMTNITPKILSHLDR